MHYYKFKRSDCVCNLCKKQFPNGLSWDHVPPKGSIDLSDMWVEDRTNYYRGTQSKPVTSQNGLKYKTICRDCNTFLSPYDMAFKDMIESIRKFVYTKLILPYNVNIVVNPIKIAKCILGHMLASKVGFCTSTYDDSIRQYLFSDNAILPEGIRIFYWFYPYNCTIISNDIYELDTNTGIQTFYSVLKCFPIAFTVVFNDSIINNTNELVIYSSDTIETKRWINFNFRLFHQWDYPERILDNIIHLVPQEKTDIVAYPKKVHK